MPKARRSCPKPKAGRGKTLVQTTAELVEELRGCQRARGGTVFAPVTFEDDDDLPRQTLPMHVVRRWLSQAICGPPCARAWGRLPTLPLSTIVQCNPFADTTVGLALIP